MLDGLEIHVHSMACQDNYSIALKKHDLMSDRIYHVYTRYIPYIYYVYTMQMSLRDSLVAHTRLAASNREFPRIFSGWGRPKFHNQVLIS